MKMPGAGPIRVTLVLFLLADMCGMESPDRAWRAGKYPLQTHTMFRTKKPSRTSSINEWSAWSPWTPCSRSCGGGITQQTRHCISRPSDPRFLRKQRRRRQTNGCVGLYRRIHLCNRKDCPRSSRDFLTEQCAAYDRRPFRGRLYNWRPFIKEGEECTLNCRPYGMDFYAMLNRTVIDGTPCNKPTTSTGRRAPSGTRGVCIDGRCKSVNANGIVGAVDDNQEDTCSACLKGTCRSINGIYTRPDLPSGYSLVAQLPQGACKIHIQQMEHTRNMLGLRVANGSFLINGDWKPTNHRLIDGAGTRFVYTKPDGTALETITAVGPLETPVDLMIITYQPNTGIKYGYALPMATDQSHVAPPLLKRPSTEMVPQLVGQRDDPKPTLHRRPRLRRRFIWKTNGLSACSKSCGGGIQATVVTCIREHTLTPVSDRRCAHLERPNPPTIRCNVQDCPAVWEAHWTPCSVSCGEGVQHQTPQCYRDGHVVDEMACPRPRPPNQSRICILKGCDNLQDNELPQNAARGDAAVDDWTVGPWSQCSTTCGTGHRTRTVSCVSGRCHPENRPKYAEYCENVPCEANEPKLQIQWLVTDWSPCTESCGTGIQTRLAFCPNGKCDDHSKPELSRACSSEKQCGGRWFIGPWSGCSDPCSAPSKRHRDVLCIVKIRGQSHVTNDITCTPSTKPQAEEACDDTCHARWFMGEWDECEGPCPGGIQRRSVRCLDLHGRESKLCTDVEMPVIKRPCICQRRDEPRERLKPAQDEPTDRLCTDKIRNCYLAVQARLCQYAYYTNHCCVSCRRAQQDGLE